MSNHKKNPQVTPSMTVKQIGTDVYGIHGLPRKSALISISASQILVDDSGFVVLSGVDLQTVLDDIDSTFLTVSGGAGANLSIDDSGSPTATGVNLLDFGLGLGVIDQGAGEVLIYVDESELTTLSGNLSAEIDNDILVLSGVLQPQITQNSNDIILLTASSGVLQAQIDQNALDIVSASGYLQAQIDDNADDIAQNVADIVLVSGSVDTLSGTLSAEITDQVNTASGTLQAQIDQNEAQIITTSGVLQADINNRVLRAGDTMTGDLTILGNFNVSGTTTTLNTEEVLVEDNELIVNSTVTGTPILDAAFTVNRGSEPDAHLYWDETEDVWKFGTSGSLETMVSASYLDSELITVSGFLQADIDSRVLRAGDTMTGFLTLHTDPTLSGHAATKQYVDAEILSVSGAAAPDVEDSGTPVLTNVSVFDFGAGLDAQDQGSGEVLISVNESELTTLSGNLSSEVSAASGVLQVQIDQNSTDILTSSGTLQSQIDVNAAASGVLQVQITQNASDISDNADSIAAASGTLQADINTRVLRAGDTMTGFLTLHADPTLSGHAVTKQYVDDEISSISGVSGLRPDIAEDGVVVVSGADLLDFGNGFSVTDQGGLEVLIEVDEAELTTLSGNLSSEIDSDVSSLSGVLQPQITQNSLDIITASGFLQSQVTDNAADIVTASGFLQSQISDNTNDITTASGYLQSQITQNSSDITTASGSLQSQITQNSNDIADNFSDILTLSGSVDALDAELDAVSGTLQIDIDSRVLRAGDTMTGFLTLSGDPTLSGHAANKNYVDSLISAVSGSSILSVDDSGSPVASGVTVLDFGNGLSAIDQGAGEVLIAVDESELTTLSGNLSNEIDLEVSTLSGVLQADIDDRVLRAGDTMTGDLIVLGNFTVSGTTTTLNTEELLVEDNEIILNYTVTGTPVLDSAVTVNRGSEPDAQLYWNELTDSWQFGTSGSLQNIASEDYVVSVSGDLQAGIDSNTSLINSVSGTLQADIDDRVLRDGDSMTDFLTLHADPVLSGHAATKQYADAGDAFNAGEFNRLLEGGVVNNFNTTITSSGGVPRVTVFSTVSGAELQLYFDTGIVTASGSQTVDLTTHSGTDENPQEWWIYYPMSPGAPILTASTEESTIVSDEVVEIARLLIGTASGTSITVYKHQNTSNEVKHHLRHLNDRQRLREAVWRSGVEFSTTVTPSALELDQVTFETTSGIVHQLHQQSFPGFTGTPTLYVVNDPADPYKPVTNLAEALTDSEGNSLSATSYSLIIWGAANKSGSGNSKLFINVPRGGYNNVDRAIHDLDKLDNYRIPSAFRGVGFLIARITLTHKTAQNGTMTIENVEDLRGAFSNAIGGPGGLGAAGVSSTFVDSTFKVLDDVDSSKILQFEVAGVTAGETRTLTIPDQSGTIALYSDLTSASGTLQSDIDSRVLSSGDAMTGFLTLHADPVLSGHAATKQYVDNELTLLSGTIGIDVEDAGTPVITDAQIIDFGLGLTAVDQGLGEVLVFVDEAQLTTLSGNLSSEIDADIAALSGVLQPQITQNALDILLASGTLQTDINNRVLRAGDTMTGFLTLHADPTLSGHAVTKQYVDDTVAAISGGEVAIEILDDGVSIVNTVSGINFGNGLTVTDSGSGLVDVVVNEAELTTLSGNLSAEIDADIVTLSGFLQPQITQNSSDIADNFADILTLSGLVSQNSTDIVTLSGLIDQNEADILTVSGIASDNSTSISELREVVQVDLTSGENLLVSGVRSFNLATEVQIGSNYTVAASGITIAASGTYRVSWAVNPIQGGSTANNRERNLEAVLQQNGTSILATRGTSVTSAAASQVSCSIYGEYYVTTSGTNEVVRLATDDLSTNSTAGVTFTSQNGYMKVERIT
jgi:hypothetical protein